MLKIGAISDLHGTLPSIKECDVLLICGDIVDLYSQRSINASRHWFINTFFVWVRNIPCKKVVMVAGNHDFYLQRNEKEYVELIKENGLDDKLIYLCDSSVELFGKVIYGTPWSEGPFGWAFSPNDDDWYIEKYYNGIPYNVDILLTHQPPKVKRIGCSYPNTPNERDFGSEYLANVIKEKRPKYAFCGHIHSGTHTLTKYCGTKMYNVSLLSEQYYECYNVKYLNIE